MSTIQPVMCDQCGKLKGEDNHWKFLWVDSDGNFYSAPTDMMRASDRQFDFCGEACLLKRISELIAKPPSSQSLLEDTEQSPT